MKLSNYLWTHGRKRLAYKIIGGELLFIGGSVVGMLVAPRPTLVVFVLPFLIARFLMMWGNWGQHAFIHPEQPGNSMLNSITCVNTRYNRRCFNDGYHIGHHLKPNRHWTEMPGDFSRNLASYAREGAIVFEGIDFFVVWLLLMLRRYDALAKCWVDVDGRHRSREEIAALLRVRALPVVR